MRFGVMFIGLHGASASTTAAAILSRRAYGDSFSFGSYWIPIKRSYPDELDALIISGWDCRFGTLGEAVSRNGLLPSNCLTHVKAIRTFPAILGPNDYVVRSGAHRPTHSSLDDAIAAAKRDIHSFRQAPSLDKIIVINMSSPMRSSSHDTPLLWDSALAYSNAAIDEGADWIEFTPSPSITPDLERAATSTGSRIAGRDGSTGQTVLKYALRDFFRNRSLKLDSWYSTNLIGNHDGLVLTHPEYQETKYADKKAVLKSDLLQHNDVSIVFCPPAGDNKEAWDCAFFRGFLGTPMSIRVNWHGSDSFLAAALVIDLICCMIHAHKLSKPFGLQPSLGIFFKSPHGVDLDSLSYAQAMQHLRAYLLE